MKRQRSGIPVARPTTNISLPVRKQSSKIRTALAANDVLLVTAETGSGKTTQIPQIILEGDPSAHIVVTQPRRVAAITVAARVAQERAAQLGDEVGYAVRFDDRSQRGLTSIRYVTDGVLLREAMGDGPSGLKKRYSHVIIDEVHERSVNTDLVLGVIKETLIGMSKGNQPAKTGFAAKNPVFAKMIRSTLPFKVIIMSATTDTDKILNFFRADTKLSVGMLTIPGTLFPVRVMNSSNSVENIIDYTVTTVSYVHRNNPLPGDMLVFLAGQEEIMSVLSLLKIRLKNSLKKGEQGAKPFCLFPLYAALSPDDQMLAIQPLSDEEQKSTRKIILSTNIAETSITIPGVVYVVDSGLVKVRTLISEHGVYSDALQVESVTVAQADQRKGRAGRTQPGVVFRLYSENQFKRMEQFPKPEILRVEASSTLLQIFALKDAAHKSRFGKKDQEKERESSETNRSLLTFPLLDPVPKKMMESSLETLILLGAVDYRVQLMDTGRLMSRIPVPPMLARSLLESLRVGCVDAMLSVAAILSAEGAVFLSPPNKRDKAKAAQRRFLNASGDHLTLVNALNAFMQLPNARRRMEFCRDHFLNYRPLASAESIRCQLDTILQHGDMVSWGLRKPLSTEVASAIVDASLDELVRRCIIAGFFRNTAGKRKSDGKYVPYGKRRNGGETVEKTMDIHPGSALHALRVKRNPDFVIYDELVRSTNGKGYLRTVVGVEVDWLTQHTSYFTKASHNGRR